MHALVDVIVLLTSLINFTNKKDTQGKKPQNIKIVYQNPAESIQACVRINAV